MNINPFIELIGTVITLYSWVLGIYIILHWLIAFNIINRYQPFVSKTLYVLGQLVEPALGRIRRYMPDLGGIDISPIVLILGLQFISRALYTYFYV
jgi:YggT family protein